MKILLINNYQQNNETATYEALKLALAEHDVTIQRYKPGLLFADAHEDLVILSGGGGEGSEIDDQYDKQRFWYEDQIKYILRTAKPILGICMGFEVISRAYGGQVIEKDKYITGYKRVMATKKGLEHFNRKSLTQYQNHKWVVPSVPAKHFEVLAESPTGVEIIRHRSRPIIATQFHPEKGGTLDLTNMILNQKLISA